MASEDEPRPSVASDVQAVLSPIEAPSSAPPASEDNGFSPLVTVVGFHHARGPEVESWFGADEGVDPAAQYGWTLLPFMALSDGAHASEEDFSYFTLLQPATDSKPATSLFGISCTRQMDSTQLINRPADVTRSTVQKAVVVIADSPQSFGMMRERLGIVTHAWFAQREFTDVEILRRFQESLAEEKERGSLQEESSRDQYLGMSLRELVHEYKWQTLVLLKCCLLQPKMLFFGSRCDKLCMIQFSLISLIPGLIRNLQDCADPELNNYEATLSVATTLQSSNRSSLLQFMGLPLQVFGKGALFGPYTPLQQLDMLADHGTKSYIVGSTNSLLLQQRDRYSDIIINLDESTVNISSPSLKAALSLTAADRRWIDYLTQEVNETWDEANPSRPKNMQYAGSEEFIRSQFEAYLLGLISSVKFHNFLLSQGDYSKSIYTTSEDDPAIDFGLEWIDAWKRTENYRMWDANTDSNLFAVSEPKHPSAGGLTMDDVQRRISEQVKDLHIDERLAQGREMLGRNFAAGREKASSVFNKLYSDVEQMREAQKRRAEEAKSPEQPGAKDAAAYPVDLAKAQQTMQSVGNKAGAYMSSWATWAGEKRKNSTWGAGWRNSGSGGGGSDKGSTKSPPPASPIDKDYQMVSPPGSRTASSTDDSTSSGAVKVRPVTQESFGESILSEARSSLDRPETAESTTDNRPLEGLGITTAQEPTKTKAPVAAAADQVAAAPSDGFQTEDVVGTGSAGASTTAAAVTPVVEETKSLDDDDKTPMVKQTEIETPSERVAAADAKDNEPVEPEVEAEPEVKPESEAKAETEVKAEPKVEAEETVEEPKVEAKAETKTKPDDSDDDDEFKDAEEDTKDDTAATPKAS